jgi:hypothetical protein
MRSKECDGSRGLPGRKCIIAGGDFNHNLPSGPIFGIKVAQADGP